MNQFSKLVEIQGHDPMTNLDRVCYYVNITSLRGTKALPAWGSTNRLCGRLVTKEYKKAKGDLKAARAAITTRFLAVTGRIIAHRTIALPDSRFLTILAQPSVDLARNSTRSAIQTLKNRISQDTSPIQNLNTQVNTGVKQGYSRSFPALNGVVLSSSSWRVGIVQNWQTAQSGLLWYWLNGIVVNSSNRGGSRNWLKTNRKRVKKFT